MKAVSFDMLPLELDQKLDVLAVLDMLDEGAPVYYPYDFEEDTQNELEDEIA